MCSLRGTAKALEDSTGQVMLLKCSGIQIYSIGFVFHSVFTFVPKRGWCSLIFKR